MSIYTPLLKEMPMAKPLAQTLITTAAEQGACLEEFQLACKLALHAYEKTMDLSGVRLSEFERQAQATLKSIIGE